MHRLTALCLAACLAGCHRNKLEASKENFEVAVKAYLERRGDLCLAKQHWPIEVPVGPAAPADRDAVQMPVLEKLGLVTSSEGLTETTTPGKMVHVKRYELTEAGRKFYLARPGQDSGPRDLCAGHVSLRKVVSWETTKDADGERAVVSYTYGFDAAPWVRDPEAQRVFPAVARVLQGEGSAELKETLALTHDGWVAVELLPANTPGKP
jgi:hypothetical protein